MSQNAWKGFYLDSGSKVLKWEQNQVLLVLASGHDVKAKWNSFSWFLLQKVLELNVSLTTVRCR